VHKEVGRLLKKDLLLSMTKFFTPTRVERLLELVAKKNSAEVTSMLNAVGKTTDYELPCKLIADS
jgi:hypothetical protein